MSDWLSTKDPASVQDGVDRMRDRPDGRHMQYARGDARFALWLALVDRRVGRMVGLSLFDLADVTLRDWFDDGMSPREAAEEALANDDTFAAFTGGLFA